MSKSSTQELPIYDVVTQSLNMKPIIAPMYEENHFQNTRKPT
jgi:hypothetical protein